MKRSSSIAIIGGGIAGLVSAIALRKKGFHPIVYEQVSDLKPVGAGVILSINAIKALSRLGLAEILIKKGRPVYTLKIKDTAGACLSSTDLHYLSQKTGCPSVGLARSSLHDVLINALPADSVRLGSEFEGLIQNTNQVELSFKSQPPIYADIAIGADGLRSKVRNALFGHVALRYSGQTSWRGIAEFPNLESTEFSETWGIGRRFGIVPISASNSYWYAGLNAPASDTRVPQLINKHSLMQMFGSWADPIPEIINATQDQDIIQTDIFDTEPTDHWFDGSVVLLGDSVHSTTPNLGQGAGMAIESALTLAQAIATHDTLEHAFSSYKSSRKKRTDWITQQSRLFGQLAQLDSPTLCKLRNWVLDVSSIVIPKAIQDRSPGQLFNYEVPFY